MCQEVKVWREGHIFLLCGDWVLLRMGVEQCLCVWTGGGEVLAGAVCGVCLHRRGGGGMVLCVAGTCVCVCVCMLRCGEKGSGAPVNLC